VRVDGTGVHCVMGSPSSCVASATPSASSCTMPV